MVLDLKPLSPKRTTMTYSPPLALPKRIHLVGRKNHGKTSLIIDLLHEYEAMKLHVGVIKHTGHDHELDTPGTDSHRLRLAGGTPTAILTPGLGALYHPGLSKQDAYRWLEPMYADCELVLVEGHLDCQDPVPKFEVWRAELGTTPLAQERDDILAVISDDSLPSFIERRPRSRPRELAVQILALMKE